MGVTVFCKFRTDDGHTWCSVSGYVNNAVTIPSGYRPKKESVVCYIKGGSTGIITLKANASTISTSHGTSGNPNLLVGDNVWQVS